MLGKFNETIQAFDTALGLNESWNHNESIPYITLGDSLLIWGRFNESIRAYDIALRLNQSDEYSWYNKGEALYALGKYDEAMKVINKTIEINPQLAGAVLYDKGLIFNKLGRHEEAIEAFSNVERIGMPITSEIPKIGQLPAGKFALPGEGVA